MESSTGVRTGSSRVKSWSKLFTSFLVFWKERERYTFAYLNIHLHTQWASERLTGSRVCAGNGFPQNTTSKGWGVRYKALATKQNEKKKKRLRYIYSIDLFRIMNLSAVTEVEEMLGLECTHHADSVRFESQLFYIFNQTNLPVYATSTSRLNPKTDTKIWSIKQMHVVTLYYMQRNKKSDEKIFTFS